MSCPSFDLFTIRDRHEEIFNGEQYRIKYSRKQSHMCVKNTNQFFILNFCFSKSIYFDYKGNFDTITSTLQD